MSCLWLLTGRSTHERFMIELIKNSISELHIWVINNIFATFDLEQDLNVALLTETIVLVDSIIIFFIALNVLKYRLG